jgi:lipopolysaccharide biosynthesis regulator YciM
MEKQASTKDLLRGLNHLLNEQQDRAIDAHSLSGCRRPRHEDCFALGNLFRRRGDYDRGAPAHEHLLSR